MTRGGWLLWVVYSRWPTYIRQFRQSPFSLCLSSDHYLATALVRFLRMHRLHWRIFPLLERFLIPFYWYILTPLSWLQRDTRLT